MSKKKDLTYEKAREYLTKKDLAINSFYRNSFNKTIGMFKYQNLPDSIPEKELEKLLQENGHCIIVEENNNLYALSGGFSGEVDVYNNPTKYTVSNVALNLSKTYEIGKDCVLLVNDFNKEGLYPIFSRYGVNMVDTEISMNLASVMLRIPMIISACDDRTKASADLFLKEIYDGKFAIIGDSPFLEGVKMQNATNQNSRYITQFIELMQYYKASFYNEIGLNANYNMKRERLTENEIGLNVDAILPLIDEMYSERVDGIKQVNEMFNTDIIVDYNSVWKTTHEEEEKETVTQETSIDDDIEENEKNFDGETIPETEPEAEQGEQETEPEAEPEEQETEAEAEPEEQETKAEAEPEEQETDLKEGEKDNEKN